MQLLMRRRGRGEKRQMYYYALLAFNNVDRDDGGANSRGCTGREKKEGEGEQNVPIGDTSDGALLELHHVAGQGPRLVRENVFHLDGRMKRTTSSGGVLFQTGDRSTEYVQA